MRAATLAVSSLLVMVTPSRAEQLCVTYAKAKIVADDGRYLGSVTSVYDPESILNKYGNYGNEYSSTSIWNEYGRYGGKYSGLSPFNPYATKPPSIVQNKKTIGRLTVNRTMQGSVSPYFLQKCKYQ